MTFQDSPTNWDKHFDDLMERVLKRIHILRVCKRNGCSVSDLDYLFNCLIMSPFNYSISVWGVAAYTNTLAKYLKSRALRRRSHPYQVASVNTERFKKCFANKCLFYFK